MRWLGAGDVDQVRETLRETDLGSLQHTTIQRLRKDGFITGRQFRLCKERIETTARQCSQLAALVESKDWERALSLLNGMDQSLAIVQDNNTRLIRAAIPVELNDYHAASEYCDRIITKDPGHADAHMIRAWPLIRIGRFVEGAFISRTSRRNFECPTASYSPFRIWLSSSRRALNRATSHFLRTLIREAKLDDGLFPVSRVLDCLLTGDRNLIERLSAEVRPIVNEIIANYGKKQIDKPNVREGRKTPSVDGETHKASLTLQSDPHDTACAE